MIRFTEKYCEFSELKDKTIVRLNGLEKESKKVAFYCDDGSIYLMYHEKECCESVDIDDVVGDVNDLIDAKVIDAREEVGDYEKYDYEDYKWTFYIIQTNKGSVTIKWYGTSNGYYSIDVSFFKVEEVNDENNIEKDDRYSNIYQESLSLMAKDVLKDLLKTEISSLIRKGSK